jgi:hypothetical protein
MRDIIASRKAEFAISLVLNVALSFGCLLRVYDGGLFSFRNSLRPLILPFHGVTLEACAVRPRDQEHASRLSGERKGFAHYPVGSLADQRIKPFASFCSQSHRLRASRVRRSSSVKRTLVVAAGLHRSRTLGVRYLNRGLSWLLP